MAFRFEFDPINRILLARFEGQLTNQSAAEYHDALGRNWRATDPRAGIWDLTGVSDFVVAADFLRSLARRKPITSGLTDCPRFIVVAETAGYGLMHVPDCGGVFTAFAPCCSNRRRRTHDTGRSIPSIRTSRVIVLDGLQSIRGALS